MIISRGRRFIFVHIPKTGGTSMALALEDRAMADDILIGDTPKAIRRRQRLRALTPAGRLWKHSTLADIDGIVLAHELSDFLIFTLVRNPWDRMVSYYHWLQTQNFAHPAVSRAKSSTFSEFLNDPATGQGMRQNSYDSYMRRADGSAVAGTYVRLEHLMQDLAPVNAHLGFDIGMGHSNQSPRPRDWRHFYSDADAAHLARICAADIAPFGYQFDPV